MSKSTKLAPDIEEKARLYLEENMSAGEIAKQYNTYAKKIQRELKAAGYTLRSRSDAQKIRLDEGKAAHPTEGKTLSEATRVKIGKQVHKSWEELSEDEREARRAVLKDRWDNQDQEKFKEMGKKAIAEAAQKGSKFEKYLAEKLTDAGYVVLVHQKHMFLGKKMHLDILIENHNIAIEVDGPSHYSPLWGEDTLAKSKAKDSKKNGLLQQSGVNIIRVEIPATVPQYFMHEQSQRVVKQVEEIVSQSIKAKLFRIDSILEEDNGEEKSS